MLIFLRMETGTVWEECIFEGFLFCIHGFLALHLTPNRLNRGYPLPAYSFPSKSPLAFDFEREGPLSLTPKYRSSEGGRKANAKMAMGRNSEPTTQGKTGPTPRLNYPYNGKPSGRNGWPTSGLFIRISPQKIRFPAQTGIPISTLFIHSYAGLSGQTVTGTYKSKLPSWVFVGISYFLEKIGLDL